MSKPREAIGDIPCPFCARDAELHRFEERTKLDPDTDAGGKAKYPSKHFIVCPPVKGYRGCGTILANGHGAQERMMELGTVFGANRATRGAAEHAPAAAKPAAAEPAAPAAPVAPPPPPPPASRNPFIKPW